MWRSSRIPKTVLATRKLALEFVEMKPAPNDRQLTERRMTVYRPIMENGLFRPCTWAACFCLSTQLWYRVNGKHTSTLSLEFDNFPTFYVNLEYYEADTLEDVAKLYATFDSKLQSRTSSEINASFAGSIPEFADIAKRTISLAVTGMSFHKWSHGYGTIPAAERAELMLDHPQFVLWLNCTLTGGSDHLKKGPVVAAMFASFQKNQKAATDFWTAVRDESGHTPSLPDRKLAAYLLRNWVAHGRGSTQLVSKKDVPRAFYVKCLHAWNAWRDGVTTDLKYYPNKKAPSVK